MFIESLTNRVCARLRRFAQRPNKDVAGTPSNERLIQWAAANPPPQHWLDGDEEDLFSRELKQ